MNAIQIENQIVDLEIKLSEAKEQLANLITDIDDFEKEDYLSESDYDDFLDDVYGEVSIGNITFSASRVLYELDPVAYRCGFSDWADSVEPEQIPEYVELTDKREELEYEIENLEVEIEEKQDELDEHEG